MFDANKSLAAFLIYYFHLYIYFSCRDQFCRHVRELHVIIFLANFTKLKGRALMNMYDKSFLPFYNSSHRRQPLQQRGIERGREREGEGYREVGRTWVQDGALEWLPHTKGTPVCPPFGFLCDITSFYYKSSFMLYHVFISIKIQTDAPLIIINGASVEFL